MKSLTSKCLLIVCLLLPAACAKSNNFAPLTSEAAQAARIKAKSNQVHTVLVNISTGALPAANSAELSSVSEEPGDGDSMAVGSTF